MTTPNDRTLTERSELGARPPSLPVPQLFLVLRCDDLNAPPSRHALMHVDQVLFGRGDQSSAERVVDTGRKQLRLNIADPRMSRAHACLERTPQGWQLTDLDSSNGCRVDGVRTRQALLRDGALFELGHTFFRLRTALPTPANALGDLCATDWPAQPAALQTLLPELALSFEQLARVARSPLPVMLLGETGTGKELLARAVHALSDRQGECVAINCGALPDTLLEAQLFGHVRGAFSGAVRDELGYVRAADRGSLFLDEVGDLPAPSQTALLRVLQESEVVPVGATRPIPVDLRVVSATHAPLFELAEAGRFRNDLFARLSGFTFRAPALRDRIEDTGLLIRALLPELEPIAGGALRLQPEAARVLLSHAWPRNIRELRQCLAAGAVLAETGTIETCHLPDSLAPREPQPAAAGVTPPDQVLQRELLARLTEQRGNITQVARAMGKARVQVQRWLKRFDIDPAKFR